MAQAGRSRNPDIPVADIEKLLESYYGRLINWAALLTRGDSVMAQDIVHDLCLHFVVARPDLRDVRNLDGYLYSCLRNIYLSALARSSREANQFISTAEFDSIQAFLATPSREDLLDRQNDLRKICSYALWRKDTAKSASYFILLFFHSYARREVAQIASVPMSAIYNKLKIAREEIKTHLAETRKLHIATTDGPPEVEPALSPISSAALFQELRDLIFGSNSSACLPQEVLLDHYRVNPAKPIPCGLLSHIVSCAPCLALVDRYFGRPKSKDEHSLDETPVDGASEHAVTVNFQTMMRIVHSKRERIYEHRPRTLSIAVNGKITASHDVQGERSTLSSRLESPETARFIEVFSEQGIRIAMLSIADLPPAGPHIQSQRVFLSDERWLDLTLSFDGQGLESEVVYFDPALTTAIGIDEDEAADAVFPRLREPSVRRASIWETLSAYVLSLSRHQALAYSLVLLLGIGSYFGYRYTHPKLDAATILRKAAKIEAAQLAGQTEHQVLDLESISDRGSVLQRGKVDLWRDADGTRYSRELYDEHQHLLAAEWKTKTGKVHAWTTKDTNQPLLANDLWKQDMSPHSFAALADTGWVTKTEEGYEVTSRGPQKGEPQLLFATLVLDRNLHPLRQTLRLRTNRGIEDVRYTVRNYERRRSSSVPDSAFLPAIQEQASGDRRSSRTPFEGIDAHSVQLTELNIAVLYVLNQLDADVSEPVGIFRTSDGRVRVVGAITNAARRKLIESELNALPHHEQLEISLVSQRDQQSKSQRSLEKLPDNASVYNIGVAKSPAEDTVRAYLVSQGLSGEALHEAVPQFSARVMNDAQLALQNAYALDRLGRLLAETRPDLLSLTARQEWAAMVAKHASDLDAELAAIRTDLSHLTPAMPEPSKSDNLQQTIEDPAAFARVARRLLEATQEINHNIGAAFAYRPGTAQSQSIDSLLKETAALLPFSEAERMKEMAGQLSNLQKTVASSGLVRPTDGKAHAKSR